MDKHRDLFARVVSSRPGRIATVIRGDDHEIVGLEPRQQLGKATIKCLKSCGIAGDVAPVTKDGVEVHKIGE